MSIKVGINGFGRIGRMVMRCCMDHPNIEIVGVNDLCPADYLAYMLKFDTMHGKFKGEVSSEGNNITLPTDPGYPVPAVPSSSGGGSADASVQESVFPGLVVTDKDGQRISYTSIRGNNVLSIRVGRFTASLRASLATLRQLRAEGIDTITFQTILCSTTLSVDELLAMGGEDAEVVLTHHIRSSTLTVGGKAV